VSKSFQYRTDIDGLRALAVLAVLFFHAHLGVSGGFVGVDIFFVISGYLITGLILQDLENGRFKILEFWARRVRRILPAMTVLILSCLAVGWCLLLPVDFKELGQSVVAQALLVSNLYFERHSGYFAEPSELMPLLHTWTLAVEEQFYLLFPLFLIVLDRFSHRVRISAICMLGAASFCLSVYCSYFHQAVNFFFLPTRACELTAGALLATLSTRGESPRWQKECASWVGLLAILYADFFYTSETRFPGTAAILPCGGAALIIWSNTGTPTSIGTLLALPPLVFIGLISYSLYLWHWPVLAFARYWALEPISVSGRLLLLLISAILAVLSWKYVETPFRKRTIFKSRDQILIFGALTTVVLLFAGFTIQKLQGLPFRFPAQAQVYASYRDDRGFRDELTLEDALNGDFVELGSGNKHVPIKLFVWGDSHAMAVLSILDILCKENGVRGVAATHSSTAPALDYESTGEWSLKEESIPYNNSVIKYIEDNRIKNVILAAKWAVYENDNLQFNRPVLKTIKALKNSGARVWILLDVPRPGLDVPRALALSVILHPQKLDDFTFPPNYYQEDRIAQDRIFQDISPSDATILDPARFFISSENRLIVVEGGKSLYFDDHHLSVAGAMKVRPLLEPVFSGIATQSPSASKQKLQ